MRLFCFGFGYSAEALARRLSARTSALAGTQDQPGCGQPPLGAQARRVQGRCGFGRGAEPAGRDDACAGQHSAGPRGRRGAAPFPRRPGGAARSRLGRLSLHRRRLRRLAGAMGRRDEPDAADLRAQPASRAGRARLARLRQARRASASRCSGSPASTGRAAASSTSCAPARPGASSSRARCSTASTSTTSPACWRPPSTRPTGHSIYNVSDDEPAPPQDVVAYAAELLGLPVPPEVPSTQAGLTGMAASFWAESKRVGNARIKADLGVELMYPTYREGLRALAATRGRSAGVQQAPAFRRKGGQDCRLDGRGVRWRVRSARQRDRRAFPPTWITFRSGQCPEGRLRAASSL